MVHITPVALRILSNFFFATMTLSHFCGCFAFAVMYFLNFWLRFVCQLVAAHLWVFIHCTIPVIAYHLIIIGRICLDILMHPSIFFDTATLLGTGLILLFYHEKAVAAFTFVDERWHRSKSRVRYMRHLVENLSKRASEAYRETVAKFCCEFVANCLFEPVR